MSYRDPHDEWTETMVAMVIAGFFFWVIFFLLRDVCSAVPL